MDDCPMSLFRRLLKPLSAVCCIMLLNVSLLMAEGQHESHGPVFVENMGQWEDCVRFRSGFRGGALFFERNAVTFVMQNREQVEEILGRKFSTPLPEPAGCMVELYAYRVHFEGALKEPRLRGGGRHSEYHNYYLGNDPSRWASGVPLYDTVCYERLYEGIDLAYYTKGSSYKYEFRVSPHADPDRIALRYEGMDRLALRHGNLIVRIGDFEAVELQPYAYQLDDMGERWEVPCSFVCNGKTVTFRLGKHDPSLPLVIDPVLVFCSYTGSFADNWGYTATYDRHGNMYGGGSVFDDGYPVSLGAYQRDYGGDYADIAITKFSSKGDSVLFSTYLGGSQSEVPHSLVVNGNDELYVLGSTSSDDFPVTAGAFDTVFHYTVPRRVFVLTDVIRYRDGIDVTISKFSSDGRKLEGSTYFGGSGPDGLSTNTSLRKNYADEVRGEIMVDEYSNVYIVSSTGSGDLPVTQGAFQKTYGGGQDGFVAKFSYDLKHLIWCSYLGGDSADAAYSMVLDAENSLYVCGGTRSRNLPATHGVVQPVYGGGGTDGFIAHISTNGNRIDALTYFGKAGLDQTYLIKADQRGDIYVMALSDAGGLLWVRNARWYVKNGSQVLCKLSPALDSVIWSTCFGTGRSTPDLSPTALMVDLCHQVYFSGWGSPSVNAHIGNSDCGTRGLPVTSDAMRFTTDNNDFYFLSLRSDASAMIYGSFFGGGRSAEHVDGGTSRFDRKGVIYQAICASCGGNNDLPVTKGVAAPRNNSSNCNLGVVKLDFNIQEVVADFSIPNIICAPDTIRCENSSRVVNPSSTNFFWDFGDGTTSTVQSPVHGYWRSGRYRIRLVVSDPSSCNMRDTMERELIVLSSAYDTLPDKTICKGDFVQIGMQPDNTSRIAYRWYPSDGLSSTEISNPIASDTVSRTYHLFMSDGVCTDTFRIRVNVLDIKLDAGPDLTVCIGDTLKLKPSVTGADTYNWSMSPDFFPNLNPDPSSSNLEMYSWSAGTYYIRASNLYCSKTDSLHVFASRVVAELPDEMRQCLGDTFCLAVGVQCDGICKLSYEWESANVPVGAGNRDSVCFRADFAAPVFVTVRNQFGCVGRDTMRLSVDSLLLEPAVTDVRCNGLHDGEIHLKLTTGASPIRYVWNPSVGNGPDLTGLPAGVYSVSATDRNGCRFRKDITVGEPLPVAAHVADSMLVVYCEETNRGFIGMAVNGGTPPYSYGWLHGDTALRIDGLCAGSYTFYVEDARRCADTVVVTVRDTSDMRVGVKVEDVRCHGRCNGSVRLEPYGVSPYSYKWSTGETAVARSGLCAGSYDVVVEDARHCRRRLFPEVREPDSLYLDSIAIVPPRCYGYSDGQIAVRLSGGVPPYWYTWDSVPGGHYCSGLSSGPHRLKCADANGCSLDTLLVLPQYDSISGTLRVTKVPCEEICNATASIMVTGGVPPYTYRWSTGDSGTAAVHNLCYGEGALVVSDSNGCIYSLRYFVGDSSTFPSRVRAWTDTYVIYGGEIVDLYATASDSGFTYRWTPVKDLFSDTGSHVKAVPRDTTTFTVVMEDVFGCRQSDTVRICVIKVYCEHPYVFVPNTFSPNGDGVNDLLYVRGDWVESLHFAIYDRWGEKMFETDDQHQGWDGTYRGKPCEQGVYVYYVEVICRGNIKNLLKGNVMLVR